jgi:hypothetical protein
VTEKLKNGKHSKTSVLKLVKLALLKFLGLKIGLSELEVSKESLVVNSSNEEDDLGPSKGRDGINGGYTVGNILACKSRGNIEGETVGFGSNVSKNGKLGNTSVLKFGSAVLVEGLLADSSGEASRVPESGRSDNSKLVLIRRSLKRSGGLGNLGGSEGSSGGDEGGKDKLHVEIYIYLSDWIRVVHGPRVVLISQDLILVEASGRSVRTRIPYPLEIRDRFGSAY